MALRGSQPDRRHVWCPFPPRSYGRVLTVDERQHVRPSAVTDREIGRDTFVTAKVQDVTPTHSPARRSGAHATETLDSKMF